MAEFNLIMPKMGESIMEATILRWLKKPGDTVALDETILEIATDKVDSEIPSPVAGTITKVLFAENAVVPVGQTIATIETEASVAKSSPATPPPVQAPSQPQVQQAAPQQPVTVSQPTPAPAVEIPYVPVAASTPVQVTSTNGRFYSPLVRSMAASEGIAQQELDLIPGTGQDGRVTKSDMLLYIRNRSTSATSSPQPAATTSAPQNIQIQKTQEVALSNGSVDGDIEIIEMDRMRKLIAEHMVRSKHTSPHVTSFVEADVTNMVLWRENVKDNFAKKYGEKITFTPIFVEAVTKALRDFPMINVSVEGDTILRKKNLHIGMAAALPSGNLIVPVIHNADGYNLVGLTKKVNDLAGRARSNKLKPEEIQGGTFTLTNVGTFGNVMGTPIINQPQVAILATGAIKKKPGVVETEYGDLIAIRHYMFLSLSYDHRVVDGALGGSFLRRVADYLERFDINREI